MAEEQFENYVRSVLRESADSQGINRDWIGSVSLLLIEAANSDCVYTKFKCDECSEKSSLYRGLVFTKSPVHQDMAISIKNPIIVLKKGSLCMENDNARGVCSLPSVDGAHVVLLEDSLCPDYRAYFLGAKVMVVQDMKHRLLRFPILISCTEFNCDQRLMQFQDCQSQTVILGGCNIDELKFIKRIVKQVYNSIKNPQNVYISSSPIIQKKEDYGPKEDVLIRDEEISSFIAHYLTNDNEQNPKCLVFSQHKDKFKQMRSNFSIKEEDYIGSLSRCDVWDAKGGKSGAIFAKTRDERFIIKEINRLEYESFNHFGERYFEHIYHSSKSCLAKIFGVYEVVLEKKRCLMVMENITFNRKVSKMFDLKGSLRGRMAQESASVCLDGNLVEIMKTAPFKISSDASLNFEVAIKSDTEFLRSVNVMDYSLLVAIDKEKQELVYGIIDYLAPYNWKKKVESAVKSLMMIGKQMTPTVISPHAYKKRFVDFMLKEFMANATAHKDCKVSFLEMEEKLMHPSIVYKIEEKQKQVLVEKVGEPSQTFEEFAASLPADECRYAVYHFNLLAPKKPEDLRIFFITWCPDTAEGTSKMIYKNSEGRFKQELYGFQVAVQATNRSEMELDVLRSRAN